MIIASSCSDIGHKKCKRGEIAILSEILRLSEVGVGKTRIMYGCNLSHKGLESYLQLLQSRNLVESAQTSRGMHFKITASGKSLLACLEDALNLLQ